MLKKIDIINFVLENKKQRPLIPLFYQVFGQPIGNAPVVVVNHALTGNSNVTGENGWWNDLIGENKTIDTNYFTVLAFNIPGNGFDRNDENLIENYKDYTIKDIANLFWNGIYELKIEKLFAVIGGSLGGAIAWEMANLHRSKIENLIPIATDFKSTDWVIANVLVQDNFLNNSSKPIEDARIHAMLFYRTPESFSQKFNRKKQTKNQFQIESWLENHGEKLKKRFQLSAYKLMNHLLKTIDVSFENVSKIESNIHLISVDTDYLFTANEIKNTFKNLQPFKENVFYYEIKSIHGHDAFLIEFEQLNAFLKPIFKTQKQLNYVSN